MRHVISAHDLSTDQIIDILDRAESMLPIARGEAVADSLRGKVLASIFFEPSTRTRLSFETAMHRLGGGVIGFAGTEATSIVKGETLADTIRMVSGYADAVVLRHPQEGAAKFATEFSDVPILNAGDGAGQHPTQTLLDLFTIRREMGRLEGLNISLVGDLRFGRTTHSLAPALARFGNTINLVSPEGLEMPGEVVEYLKSAGMLGTACHSLEEIVPRKGRGGLPRRPATCGHGTRKNDHHAPASEGERDRAGGRYPTAGQVLHPGFQRCAGAHGIALNAHRRKLKCRRCT